MKCGFNFVGHGNHFYNPDTLYATSESAGFDLYADIEYRPVTIYGDGDHVEIASCENNFVVVPQFGRTLIRTGLRLYIPHGTEAQVRSRSGLTLKRGLVVLNSPGTIDSDYDKEIGVILANTTGVDQIVDHGERIAQLVINEIIQVKPTVLNTNEYDERMKAKGSSRDGGFGSTGTK